MARRGEKGSAAGLGLKDGPDDELAEAPFTAQDPRAQAWGSPGWVLWLPKA